MSEDSLFDWDQWNVGHLRRHRVSTSEFEEAVLNDAIELEYEDEAGEPRFKSLGRTNGGRILVLVWTIRSEKVRGDHSLQRGCTSATAVAERERGLGTMPTTKVPRFKDKAEEARWWDSNRTKLDAEFAQQIEQGKAKLRTRADLMKRLKGPTRAVTVRLAETDIALAKAQAEKKGLPYQTYIKSLLHEALRKAS